MARILITSGLVTVKIFGRYNQPSLATILHRRNISQCFMLLDPLQLGVLTTWRPDWPYP